MKSFRFLPLICVGVAVSGCGPKTESASNSATAGSGDTASGGVVTIISPHSREIQTEFAALWKTKNPGIELKWLDQGGTSDDLNFVRSQYASSSKEKGIGIDLFFGGGPETFTELEDDGLLAPLDSDFGIPAKLNGLPLVGKDKSWVAAALSGFGILYNKKIATRDKLPVPVTWEGLTDPKLRDRVALADPRHSGSAHTAYEIILQSNGWDKGWKILTAMAGNARTFETNSGKPLQNVQNGEAVFCPAIDFYAQKAIKQAGADKMGYIEPKGQFVVTADPIAMLPGAPNAEGAKKFVNFVMSKEAQNLWFLAKGTPGGPKNEDLYRLPSLPSAYKPIPKGASTQLDPYSNKNTSNYDSDKAAVRRRALDVLIGVTLVDNLDAVKAAWAKNPNLDATGFVPVSESEFMGIAAKWDDAKFVSEMEDKWSAASRAKFQ
ncbi:ABC transporter substrate-binding protein [bacterium]|nr:MAG: ABC transporter substrate-binding protein [bacterium]